MRLALKLVLAFVVANIALAAVYGYVAVERESRRFAATMREEAESLGPPMQAVLIDAWRNAGERGLEQTIHDVEQVQQGQHFELHIRWVWFNRRAGEPEAPAAPPERLTKITLEQHLTIETTDPTGDELIEVYWPVPLANEPPGGLEFSESMRTLTAERSQIVERTAWLIGGMVVISGLLAAGLGVRMIGRPLRRLIDKTRRVGAGDFTGPIHLQSRDELTELGESLNQMCAQLADWQAKVRAETAARLTAIEQLRHTDRLKTVGRLAAGIAHELGTPLNVVSGRAGLIQSGKLAAEEIGSSAAAIKTEVDRMTQIIRQLLDFARVNTPRRAAVDLRPLIERTVALLRPLADGRNVRLCFAAEQPSAIATFDAEQVQQTLVNIMVNAIQAMPNGGKIEITLGREEPHPDAEPGNGRFWCISIRDEGPGIAAEDMPHLFEPFFTTKQVGEGTGLGLSIAYGIVQEHGGRIEVESRLGEGSCFKIYLPEGPMP